nr:hypothetical protein [Chloromonas rosae]
MLAYTTYLEIKDFISHLYFKRIFFNPGLCVLSPLPKDELKQLRSRRGIYLLVNSVTNRFYIGSSTNLQQRRREYASWLTSNNKTFEKLNSNIQQEVRDNNIPPSTFFFIPILFFDNLISSPLNLSGSSPIQIPAVFTEWASQFLDEEIEEKILINVFQDQNLTNYKYNVTTSGDFRLNNKLGGYRESNAIAVNIDGYNFPSYVAAATALNISTKTLRNQRIKPFYENIINEISYNDYLNSNANGFVRIPVNPDKLELTIRNSLLVLIGCRTQ